MTQEYDPVLLEVMNNGLVAVAEEMGAILQRTSYSTNIKTRLDFSCGIVNSSLELVAQAFHQPGHLGTLSSIAEFALREYGLDNLEPGDGILINDPHKGGTHIPDVTLISPFFYEGELICCFVNLAHHSDMGGKSPGSVPADATEIYQEGLIIPPIPLVRNDKIDNHIFRFIAANVRTPEERLGDFRAQVAANILAKRRMLGLIEKYGKETVLFYMGEILNYAEKRTRAEIARLPQGFYQAEDFLDSDGIGNDPLKVAADITITSDKITVDFSRSDPQGKGPLNGRYPTTFSGVVYPLKCFIAQDIPVNSGFYRPIEVIAPEGTVVNAKAPAAVGGTWETCMRVVDVVIKALSGVFAERVAAAPKGIICNITYGGKDPRTGKLFAFYETVGGGFGGRPMKDGLDGVQCHYQNTPNAPVEELESIIPVLVKRYEFIPDSDGPGEFRGGLGIRRDLQFYSEECVFSVLADRGRFAPYGLFGGGEARKSHFIIDPDGPEPVVLPSKALVRLKQDQIFSIQTPGGGGYGDPARRDPLLIKNDIRDEKISKERAREIYGTQD